jgi:putative ABC transport system permease protein
MMKKLLFNFQLALEGVAANRLRAFLTALGIVFGVAAVIAMLAIGTGAREAILAQMRLIGANNIVVTSLIEAAGDDDASAQSAGQEKNTKPWSPGLNLGDVRAINAILPGVEAISPEVVLPTTVIRDGKIGKSRAVGVSNAFFELNNLQVERGKLFHDVHQAKGDPVCIVGKDIVRRFFSEGDPIGERIKCGQTWLRIIGVLEERIAKKDQLENLGIRDYNQDIYIPLQTALIRFKDRSYAHSRNIGNNRGNNSGGDDNYHQLDRMVIRVADSDELLSTSNVVARLLKRRHQTVIDYEMAVPEKMLEAQQQTQDTFNKVLAFIAGISLLVGGIGIMNIMLASVLERTKEIGTRRSLGATQQDIVQQFLLEAIFISLMGGISGIILGVGASSYIGANYDIPTAVSAWSVILSFGVASVIGLVFGLFPARRAAKLDPIKALRSD